MGVKEDRAEEAAQLEEAHAAEQAKVRGWGTREVLHWLVDQVSLPHYERAGQPTAAAVREAVDAAHGYTPPPPPETVAEQLAELARRRAEDAARAERAAGVENTPVA